MFPYCSRGIAVSEGVILGAIPVPPFSSLVDVVTFCLLPFAEAGTHPKACSYSQDASSSKEKEREECCRDDEQQMLWSLAGGTGISHCN